MSGAILPSSVEKMEGGVLNQDNHKTTALSFVPSPNTCSGSIVRRILNYNPLGSKTDREDLEDGEPASEARPKAGHEGYQGRGGRTAKTPGTRNKKGEVCVP